MTYVIIRDADTNAFTPVNCLERLYRPFLDRGLPVNLATIPDVATNATRADGKPEGFLEVKPTGTASQAASTPGRTNGNSTAKSTEQNRRTVPIGENTELVSYL